MKRSVLLLCLVVMTIFSYAQTATNADGTIKFRGNVAIMVTSHSFTKDKGVFKQILDDEVVIELKSALNAMAMQKFGNASFGIVNRDNEAYANVRKVLEEQKLEDYIDGFSVQAKGEGADCLFLSDITMYSEDNVLQMFISCRMINIQNNMGFHYSMKTDPIDASNKNAITKQVKDMIGDYETFLYEHIIDVYPEQYGISKADGKKLYLASYQPNGRILESDKFYAFKYSQETLNLGGRALPVQVLQKVTEATNATNAGGYCLVKADNAVKPSNDIVLFRNLEEPKVSSPMAITYFALTYDANTHDGLIKNRVNNAAYDALTRHPGTVIIEQEHLPDLKKERELQKTEDFIDGHVVEQMKAFGAEYMLHLDNFVIENNLVHFKLNMVSIEQNRILRSVDISTSIDNIEDEMYKQICERISYPCNVKLIDKKRLSVISGWSLPVNTEISILANKPIENPITKEISYSKTKVCTCTVSEYMGNKFSAVVEKVDSKEDFSIISKYSEAGLLTIQINPTDIKTDMDSKSAVEKKVNNQERKKKFMNALKSISVSQK